MSGKFHLIYSRRKQLSRQLQSSDSLQGQLSGQFHSIQSRRNQFSAQFQLIDSLQHQLWTKQTIEIGIIQVVIITGFNKQVNDGGTCFSPFGASPVVRPIPRYPIPPPVPCALVKPRMPYFSYLSMLFFYETLGWWSGGAEVRKVHFAEVCLSKTQDITRGYTSPKRNTRAACTLAFG